jgi:hypothetical protein
MDNQSVALLTGKWTSVLMLAKGLLLAWVCCCSSVIENLLVWERFWVNPQYPTGVWGQGSHVVSLTVWETF